MKQKWDNYFDRKHFRKKTKLSTKGQLKFVREAWQRLGYSETEVQAFHARRLSIRRTFGMETLALFEFLMEAGFEIAVIAQACGKDRTTLYDFPARMDGCVYSKDWKPIFEAARTRIAEVLGDPTEFLNKNHPEILREQQEQQNENHSGDPCH